MAGTSRDVRRVVIVVFDGLRPDLVSAQTMPHLHRFRERGASFVRARSVFPSMTRVCSSSIATGAPPATHGIVGNAFFHPALAGERALDLGTIEDFGRFAELGEPALTAPTLGDVLAVAGKRMAIVHGGTPGATFALAPRAAQDGHWGLQRPWAAGQRDARRRRGHARAVRPGAGARRAAARGRRPGGGHFRRPCPG
jgi:hypothetical protein